MIRVNLRPPYRAKPAGARSALALAGSLSVHIVAGMLAAFCGMRAQTTFRQTVDEDPLPLEVTLTQVGGERVFPSFDPDSPAQDEPRHVVHDEVDLDLLEADYRSLRMSWDEAPAITEPRPARERAVERPPTDWAPRARRTTERFQRLGGTPGVESDQTGYVESAAPSVNPPPKYPRLARRSGYEGKVVLLVTVCAGGSPIDVRVQESSGYACLDDAAVDAVRKWQFRPARRGDRAVEGKVEIPIRFVLEARYE